MWPAGSELPDQGSNLCPLQWKRGVLTTGPPGNSPIIYLLEMRKLRPREAGLVTHGHAQMVTSRAERIQERHL